MRHFILAALLLATAAGPATALTTAGPLAELARAVKLGVPVALPTDLPPDSALVRATIQKDMGGSAYTAFYRVGKGPVGFAIESAAGGIGDLISDLAPRAQVQPKQLGAAYAVGLYWHLSGMAKSPRSWYSAWIPNKAETHFYRIAGPLQFEAPERAKWGASKDVDKAWAVRICNSLAPWKP